MNAEQRRLDDYLTSLRKQRLSILDDIAKIIAAAET